MDDVSYGAVEHIRPKSVFPNLAATWSNLGYCCSRCNTNKGAYWVDSAGLRLLNPYEDSVSEHLAWAGPLPVVAGNSTRGENTLRQLKFSARPDLLVARARRLEELDLRIRRWELESREAYKDVLAEDVRIAIADTVEFAAALQSFAEIRGFVSEGVTE